MFSKQIVYTYPFFSLLVCVFIFSGKGPIYCQPIPSPPTSSETASTLSAEKSVSKSPPSWSALRLKNCYLDLDEVCTQELIQKGLNRLSTLSKEDQITLRTYQALIAFTYRDQNRLKAILNELIALDPDVHLPKSAPKSMVKALNQLRPKPSKKQWSLDIAGLLVPLEDQDAQTWNMGYGGRLGGYVSGQSWGGGLVFKGVAHSSRSPYMTQLNTGRLSVHGFYFWEKSTVQLAIGGGPHLLIAYPLGLFNTDLSFGFGIDLLTRILWKFSSKYMLKEVV